MIICICKLYTLSFKSSELSSLAIVFSIPNLPPEKPLNFNGSVTDLCIRRQNTLHVFWVEWGRFLAMLVTVLTFHSYPSLCPLYIRFIECNDAKNTCPRNLNFVFIFSSLHDSANWLLQISGHVLNCFLLLQ